MIEHRSGWARGKGLRRGAAAPGQNSAVFPVLQLADGSYVGSAFGSTNNYMVAFDASGSVKWTVPGYNPDIATADGGMLKMAQPTGSSESRSWLLVSTAAIALLLALGAFLYLSRNTTVPKMPTVPVPVVSNCTDLSPGTKRVGARAGDRYMLQFTVPQAKVRIREGVSDAPPLLYGFDIRPQGGESLLTISYGPPSGKGGVDSARGAYTQVEKRVVVDDTGHFIGEDNLRYLNTGRRSRSVLFQGWVTAQYSSVSDRDAALFDQIINSACLLPSGGS